MKKVLIIAEAGVNHNGDIDKAYRLIDAAKEAGADLVKFQTFKSDSIASSQAKKAEYQVKNTNDDGSQLEMLKKLELSYEDHAKLIEYCKKAEIGFFSTAFDLESLDYLNGLGFERFKIPSGEITNFPYLKKVGGYKKEVILSTGMASLGEIEEALNVLTVSGTPKDKITVLHCTTSYPTEFSDVNLEAMNTIKNAFGVHVGYSDHTLGISVPLAAVALGATVVEKHFTLDRNLPGPDHISSLEPTELIAMVKGIREVEAALGSKVKTPTPIELENRKTIRKSIVAKCDIESGDLFSEENITVKRPGTGASPMNWDEFIGKPSPKSFKKDEPVTLW